MITREQIKYALQNAPDPVDWVYGLVHNLEERLSEQIKYGTKVTVYQEHWRPASEVPHVDENGNSEVVFAVNKCGCLEKVYYHVEHERNLAYWVVSRDYNLPELVFETEWWCYKPEKTNI